MSAATSTDDSPSQSPIHGNNAPKFGTLVPNRIFVGGILSNTTESELYEFFAVYGNVVETKIIADRAGVSKGYGFVTFETEEEARQIQKEESLIMKDHKLNIAPAIRKQGFSRTYSSADSCSSGERPIGARHTRAAVDYSNYLTSPTVADPSQVTPSGTVYFQTPTQYSYPNNYVYATSDGSYSQQQAYYPLVYPSTVYIPQQYYQSQTVNPAQWGGQPARWATHMGYAQSSSPLSNGNSPTVPAMPPSASPYMYSSTNGGSCSLPATSSGGTQVTTAISTSSAGNNNNNSSSSITTSSAGSLLPADSVVASGSMSVPMPALFCSYPPPLLPHGHVPYQPNYGGGDLMDSAILEATCAEQPGQLQGYGTGSSGRGYQHQQQTRGRGGQSSGSSPRKGTLYAMQYTRQSFPRYQSPQQQHYRQKRTMVPTPLHAILLPSGMGDMGNSMQPPHGGNLGTATMTPPPTPVEVQQNDGNIGPIMEATSRFNALAL